MSAAVTEIDETKAHVALLGVGKRFSGTAALTSVDLAVKRGSVHALVGENGAGKSTLGKIIAGVHQPSSGSLLVNGESVRYRSPHDALRDGITIVQQEIALVPQRTVLQNVFISEGSRCFGFVRRRANRRALAQLVAQTGFDLPPDARARDLRVPEQQQVEVLRALVRRAQLIVFDEPTASLTESESERLRAVIRSLQAAGTTIVFVSHDLDEVLQLADVVTVLRNGEVIRTAPASEETKTSLVEAMLGRAAAIAFPAKEAPPAASPIALRVSGLCRRGAIDDISFEVREGEIVALAGLVGSGRSEVARAIFGVDRRDCGSVEVAGTRLRRPSPKEAISNGLALLPESRKEQGLLMLRSSRENTTVAHLDAIARFGFVDNGRERRTADHLLTQLAVKQASGDGQVSNLSGGNQQKVLFAKWLYRRPRVLIADEPTRGVDIGAKLEIYRLLTDLAREGLAIVLISSELEEVAGLAHRVLIMRRGTIVGELAGTEVTDENILYAAFGHDQSVSGGEPPPWA